MAIADELVGQSRAWVVAVHPHARHLERTLYWLLVLEPGASPAMQIAAVTHDIERAFEPGESPPDSADPASPVYNAWHQERSARMVAAWLEEHDAPPALVDEVERLVRVHEEGGGPGADLLQAADSIAFLEVQADLFKEMVRDGRLSRARAERKFQWMYDRVRLPRAKQIAAPMLASALQVLDAEPGAGASGLRADDAQADVGASGPFRADDAQADVGASGPFRADCRDRRQV